MVTLLVTYVPWISLGLVNLVNWLTRILEK
jgi:hypothetical protein